MHLHEPTHCLPSLLCDQVSLKATGRSSSSFPSAGYRAALAFHSPFTLPFLLLSYTSKFEPW